MGATVKKVGEAPGTAQGELEAEGVVANPGEATTEGAIEARGLGRRFGSFLSPRWAVRGLDLGLPWGSITALLGRNAAGKSTTIHMLLGLLPPTEGTVRVLGQDPRRAGHAVFKDVAYVSEKRELLEDLTVEGLALLVAEVHGARFDPDGFEALRARYRLERRQRCAVLSQGQRARLLLALAVSARPRVLVLDEPTSGLDVVVRDDFLEALAAYVADAPPDAPRAVLLSTHIIEDVARICDRAVVVRPGRPALAGELDALRAGCGVYVVRLTGVLDGPPPALPPGAVLLERDPRALTIAATGPAERVEAELDQALPIAGIERRQATLKEAFVCWTEPPPGAEGGA